MTKNFSKKKTNHEPLSTECQVEYTFSVFFLRQAGLELDTTPRVVLNFWSSWVPEVTYTTLDSQSEQDPSQGYDLGESLEQASHTPPITTCFSIPKEERS